jgi:SPP1 gp7 family putative phage head morphogenesis protein
MGTQLSRILANGLLQGSSPYEIAREMTKTISGLSNSRAMSIARTETIAAHAEAQLNAFKELGIKEVGLKVEWSTAGDELVCPQCEPLEGIVLTIDEARGLIPLHANCRCMWIPAEVGEDKTGQLWGKKRDTAILKSIAAQGGINKTDWVGKKLI